MPQFAPLLFQVSIYQVPAAVANEKYLNHSKSPPRYAPIRRKMPSYADHSRRVLELSESVEVA